MGLLQARFKLVSFTSFAPTTYQVASMMKKMEIYVWRAFQLNKTCIYCKGEWRKESGSNLVWSVWNDYPLEHGDSVVDRLLCEWSEDPLVCPAEAQEEEDSVVVAQLVQRCVEMIINRDEREKQKCIIFRVARWYIRGVLRIIGRQVNVSLLSGTSAREYLGDPSTNIRVESYSHVFDRRRIFPQGHTEK